MRVAMLNIPIEAPWLGPSGWITVPPQTYGGVQWVIANLIDGLVESGHEVLLLGAPGSPVQSGLEVIDIGQPAEIRAWLANNADAYDIFMTIAWETFSPTFRHRGTISGPGT